MKRSIFKSMLFLCSFVCLTAVFVLGVSAKTVTSDGFVFDVSGKTATVKEYIGTEKSVTIPSKVGSAKVTAIGDEAFWSIKTMTSVTIPSTVKTIGKAAFNECTGLKKVVLPQELTKIGSGAFWYCTNLKQIVIFDSVKSIGTNAFKGCKDLKAYVVKGSYAETYVKGQSNLKLHYRYVDKVSLSKTSAKLEVGGTLKLTATLSPSNIYISKKAFSSSDTKIATVTSDGTIKAVAPGTVTITCSAKDKSGKKATCKITVVPKKVSGIKQSSTTATGYTLSWSKSSGATKYRVYRYNEAKKKWETIKYTTSTSLKITNCALGSSQKYRILAYTSKNKTYYKAPYSETFTARPLYPAKVTGVTAKPAHNFINLSWSKAANATGYRVYSYNASTKKYTYIGSTKSKTYKVKSLKPNTSYTFAVRAYMTYGKKTIYSSYSSPVSCTTRPDYVKGLSVKENSVYVSKLTLQWTPLKGVSGYRITKYDPATKEYIKVVNVYGADKNEYTVEDLLPGTTYSFKIQSFVRSGSSNLYGYASSKISATTNSRPADNQEAFNGFIEAYNASKNTKNSFSLIRSVDVSGFEGESSDKYTAVTEKVAADATDILYFVNGIENVTKSPVTSFIAPKDAFTTLSKEQLKADSLSFSDDGNGFRITFALNEDTDGSVNALITDLIDWQTIATEIEGFTLNSCTYEGTTVNAKVQNGLIDDIIVSVPVKVNFTIGEENYEFTETITKEFMFIW